MYGQKATNNSLPKADAFGNGTVSNGDKVYRLPKGFPIQADRSLVERSLVNAAKKAAENGEVFKVMMEVTIVLADKPEMDGDDIEF